MTAFATRMVGLAVMVGLVGGAAPLGAQAEADLARAQAAMARTQEEMAVMEVRMAGVAQGVSASLDGVSARLAGVSTRLTGVSSRLAGISSFTGSEALPAEPPAPPEGWLQNDPGDSLYSAAREALNRGEPEQAASLFQDLRRRYPTSGYVGDSYYYEAYALQRMGGESDLERALDLLEQQGREHADAPTRRDARVLRTRIQGMLARLGNEDAVVGIQSQAAEPCGDEDDDVRLMALNALLNMDADRAVPVLKEVLQSRGECSARLRKRAVFLLSQKMTDETVGIMLDLAQRNPDPSPEVREAAVFWLSQVHSADATDALQQVLQSSNDQNLQEKALFALSQRQDDRSLEILRSYAERSDVPEDLREKAVFWLGQHPKAGSAYLRELYPRIDNADLKEKVLFSVSQRRTEENQKWLLDRARDPNEDQSVREKAIFWASQAGIQPADLLAIYNSLDEPALKEKVLFGLSQQHSDEAVDALMDLARNEDNPDLKRKAIFWLGQTNDPRVTDFLMELLKGGGGS